MAGVPFLATREQDPSSSRSDTTRNATSAIIRPDRGESLSKLQKELLQLTYLEADEKKRLGDLKSEATELEASCDRTKERISEIRRILEDLGHEVKGPLIIKQEQIIELKVMIEELTEKLANEEASHKEQEAELDREIKACEQSIGCIQREMQFLEHAAEEQREHVEYPGPRALWWVEGNRCRQVSTAIVALNLMTLFEEFTHPEIDFASLDNAFLAFYTVELVLRLLVQRRQFLFGDPPTVAWNWLDVVIVASGFVQFVAEQVCGSQSSFLAILQILRISRVLRIFRILRIFCTADVSSLVEGHEFQAFMMGVILFNTIVMGLEVQFKGFFLWVIVESCLLTIYVFELGIRIRASPRNFFLDFSNSEIVWNYLDLAIVAGGVFDQWVMQVVQASQRAMGKTTSTNHALGRSMQLMRMARLARIFRLIRLIKGIPPLHSLVVGGAKAMQGASWVMVLTWGTLYISALVGIKLVGEGYVVPKLPDKDEERRVRDTFKNVPVAIFNLFKAMNGDLGGMEPLMDHVPVSKLFMVLFIVITNWAIFSILTAVVSENMAKVASAHAQVEQEEQELKSRQLKEARVEFLFNRLDENGDGRISITEFKNMLKEEVTRHEMCEMTGLDAEELEDIFSLFSKVHDGGKEETMTRHDFVMCMETAVVDKAVSKVTARSIMKLDKRMRTIEKFLAGGKRVPEEVPATRQEVRRSNTTWR